MGTSATPRPIQRALTRLPAWPKTFTPRLTRPRSFRDEQLRIALQLWGYQNVGGGAKAPAGSGGSRRPRSRRPCEGVTQRQSTQPLSERTIRVRGNPSNVTSTHRPYICTDQYCSYVEQCTLHGVLSEQNSLFSHRLVNHRAGTIGSIARRASEAVRNIS
jgi:hypothetical protein